MEERKFSSKQTEKTTMNEEKKTGTKNNSRFSVDIYFNSHEVEWRRKNGSASSIYWVYEILMLNTRNVFAQNDGNNQRFSQIEYKSEQTKKKERIGAWIACYHEMCMMVCQQLEIYLSNNIVNIHYTLFLFCYFVFVSYNSKLLGLFLLCVMIFCTSTELYNITLFCIIRSYYVIQIDVTHCFSSGRFGFFGTISVFANKNWKWSSLVLASGSDLIDTPPPTPPWKLFGWSLFLFSLFIGWLLCIFQVKLVDKLHSGAAFDSGNRQFC